LTAWDPGFAAEIEEAVGTIGTFVEGVRHPIGACAEQHAANDARKAGKNWRDGTFGPATRGLKVIDYCPICRKLFGLP